MDIVVRVCNIQEEIKVFGERLLTLKWRNIEIKWMCVVAEIDGDGVLGMDILSKLNLQMSGHVREMQLHKSPNIRKINNENLENR